MESLTRRRLLALPMGLAFVSGSGPAAALAKQRRAPKGRHVLSVRDVPAMAASDAFAEITRQVDLLIATEMRRRPAP